MRKLPVRLVAVTLALLFQSACSQSPVSIRNCSVRDAGPGRVAFTAEFQSTVKPASQIYVVATSSDPLSLYGPFETYIVRGYVPTNEWVKLSTVLDIRNTGYTLKQHLAWQKCEARVVDFTDGTGWSVPSAP